MGTLSSKRFSVGAFILIAVMEVTNPAFAQNINDPLTIFGGDRQRALRHAALAEWRRLPPAEIACIDQGLRQKGSSADALVRRGVKPSAAGLAELRSSCHRQFVQGVQTNSPRRGPDASQASSPTPTIAASNPTEPKDAGVTPPSSTESSKNAGVTPRLSTESPKDVGVTAPSSTETPKDSSATPPSSEESVGRVAEEQVQQGNAALKDGRPEGGIMVWLSAAFLFAVAALAALLGLVIYLFIRWRNTGQRTVPVSLPGGGGNTASESTIGITGEVVMSLADKTKEEAPLDTVSIETSRVSATGSSVVENLAQLARLCAMGTPSEKDFQRIKGLISQSLEDAQERKV